MIDAPIVTETSPLWSRSRRAATARLLCLHRRSIFIVLLTFGLLVGGCGRDHQLAENVRVLPNDTTAESPLTDAVSAQSINSVLLATQTIYPSGFAGSQTCAACHQERFDGYYATHHSRSFRRPDLREEAPWTDLTHEPSGQAYSVKVLEDELHHVGWKTFDGLEYRLPIADATIKYVVGSGAFAKSYLFEDRDSLIQSPLSYFVSNNRYDMSPGYDQPSHFEFTREINDQCLFCHVGILERKDNSPNHVQIQELAIGCERCHGAGREHLDEMQVLQNQTETRFGSAKLPETSDDQLTSSHIVHPGKLDRERVEALCAQCHLQGNVSMHPAGMNAWSFLPGQPLSRTKIEYSVAPEASSTAFVGHFDQLRSSVCYQATDTLNCITCHDPHHDVPNQQRIEVRRQQCLSCHSNESCGVSLPMRLEKAENDCVVCHMPRNKTEVPHVSITNHRIAIYGNQQAKAVHHATGTLPTPIALLDGSPPGSWQRERNEVTALAIWYLDELGYHNTDIQGQEVLRRLVASLSSGTLPSSETQNVQALIPVVGEATTRAYLARLLVPSAPWRTTPIVDLQEKKKLLQAAGDQARIILRLEPTPTPAHETALLILASEATELSRFADAVKYYERLTKIRRDHVVWYNLGLAYAELGLVNESARALVESIRISATFSHSYRSLSRLYDYVAPDRSQQIRQIAELLDDTSGSQ